MYEKVRNFMTPQLQREIEKLISANRDAALWNLPRDYVSQTHEAARRVLERIAARGNRATWIRARQLLHELKVGSKNA